VPPRDPKGRLDLRLSVGRETQAGPSCPRTEEQGLLGLDQVHPSRDRGRSFDHHLRHIIKRYGLATLFSDDGPGPRHHAIRPAGYDFHSDAVIPIAMEQWRADYRAMAAHRQMLAASIIWLYRGGKDSCWLRRVPCTWRAADGLHALRSGGYRRLGPAVSPLPRLVATPRSSPLTEAAAPCTMTAQLRSWSSAVKSAILRA
jgi:hypothetical protein